MDLTKQKCVACEGAVKPLDRKQAEEKLKEAPGWKLTSDAKSITKSYTFKDFKEALEFVNKVGHLAEDEGHHPDIHLTGYKNVRIDLTTHAIDGLFINDFILASKIDA
ncbi:MAG: 4a-hydroxytetrahydrobiopterin dehydratase [Candidatus Buchananbacteria bacterium CG10_big_fil_rev_8_21_14_0_10_42_9]|uniref:4a-hydroxytetrahydrobiopterin dehydratase n=1 Tax=Candidatus Buchananbacteria bacterium CG10_big_fil_rev_8_21_14_0_10_42_9 TaxID=1974526 RepID=A0A2H0VZN2_9BACT|nr:MAG: 4a-hydroxytetrahydrobiopterin dehydratase [Candidatus Buchananbacteria bacterium CG10_big_fil_rev_8_21_14_0_10_42_9]